MSKRAVVSVFALALAAAAPVAQAQFGGVVLDPTQSAHAVVQIGNEEKQLANDAIKIENGQQIFTTSLKMAATALQTYSQLQQQYQLTHAMMLAPSTLYSRFLSPQSDLMLMQQSANHYSPGNANPWINSSNTGAGASSSIQLVSVPSLTTMIPGYTTSSMAGQQQIAAQGATIDLGDAVTTTNLQAIGTIRAAQLARQTDITNLETATASTDPTATTEMAVLMRINQALLLQLRTMQDANQINANASLQQLIVQKQQQDAMKAAFRDSNGYENYYNSNITPTATGAANLLTQSY
jgi:hypothetical protein